MGKHDETGGPKWRGLWNVVKGFDFKKMKRDCFCLFLAMRGLLTLFCEILKCGFGLKNGKVSDETEAAIELYFQLSIKIENTKWDLSENWFGFFEREREILLYFISF